MIRIDEGTKTPGARGSVTVDVHSHVLPKAFLELASRGSGFAKVSGKGDRWVVRYGDGYDYRLSLIDYDIDEKLSRMDAAGIDISVISPNIPGPDLLGPDLAVAASQLLNDSLTETARGSGGRFVALASLPWTAPGPALDELRRVDEELHMRGVSLHSHLGTLDVDDERLDPIYAEIARRNLPLVLHPTVPRWGAYVREYHIVPMLGLQVDSSFALMRLVLSGVMDRHPGLRVLMPHAGGVLPFMMGRIEHQATGLGRAPRHLTRPVGEYFRRVYLDSVTPSAETLAFALRFSGSELMVFGSDDPWVDMPRLVAVLEEQDLDADAMRAVRGGNAAQLFRLELSEPTNVQSNPLDARSAR